MSALAASMSSRAAVAAPVRVKASVRRAAVKPAAASAKLQDASRLGAATAAAIILLQAAPAFAGESAVIAGATTNAEGKAAALKLQAELAKKMSTATRKNFSGADAPREPFKASAPGTPKASFSAPSFSNPFAGGGSAPAAAKPAESSGSEEGASLLPVLLLLFSPLLIVQAISAQTVVRLGSQAISGTQATKK